MAACAVLMSVVAGIATDYVAFRPVRNKTITAVLITSFAFSTLLQNAALLFISPRPRPVPLPEIFSRTVEIGGVMTPARNLITIAVAVVMLGLFSWLMRAHRARHRHARGGVPLHHGADARACRPT